MKYLRFFCLTLTLGVATLTGFAGVENQSPSDLTIVVMDPLSLPLSCPCVQGYAQRDYDKLAAHLEKKLGRKVSVVFHESLTVALKTKTQGKADIVIGKQSVVAFDAKTSGLELTPVAALSGKDGLTTQTGLIVVPSYDPAKKAADLKGYRIIFGPKECDEKHVAALALLESNGVLPPKRLETNAACSDGATLIMEAGKDVRAAAVISSYAKPLLEGCGTIKKGDLRIVGETAPVPFITAFVNGKLSEADRTAITKELLKISDEPALCLALETKRGFVELPKPTTTAVKKN